MIRVLIVLALAGLTAGAQTRSTPHIHVSAERGPVRPGDVVVLTIETSTPSAPVRVRAFNRALLPFAVDAKRWRVLIGIDLDTRVGSHEVTIEAGESPELERVVHRLVVTPRQFRTRTLTVDEAFVNPPAAALDRIARETAELNALWAASTAEKLWKGPFLRPVPDPANSAFGTRSILNGQPRSPHSGADFNSPTGTPIKSPNAGRVVLAGDRYFTGNTVMIDHGLTLFSLFAHLSEMDVHEGDTVASGQVIGKVGATGRVTGPHLHWSVRLNGARVDPLSLLSALGR
jgi:murein DD-endopeptidase MepM/ murein hydrolase activator NlpD